jgi:hypothetical protein
MAEKSNWLIFYAHLKRLREDDEESPEYYGVFVCPESRRDPEVLLEEVLSNRKLFLSQIVEQRSMRMDRDWGSNERLKAQVEQLGYGMAVTKLQRGMRLED